jgi:hypothetical protein
MADDGPLNPFSFPCILVSILAAGAVCTIVWTSYSMGKATDSPTSPSTVSHGMWISLGCCLAILAVAVIKFVD